MTTEQPYGGVKQLVVNPHDWPGLVAWLDSRGFIPVPTPGADPDDLPTYILYPKAAVDAMKS